MFTEDPHFIPFITRVNADLGNLMTSNAVLLVQIDALNRQLANNLSEKNDLFQQLTDMGLTNTKLKSENEELRKVKSHAKNTSKVQ
jgi:regulator of replication initiation timing